jgi:hypothetical protein
VSNDDRDNPDFGDFDLPDEMFEPGDQTAQPTEDFTEPTEELPWPDGSVQPLGDDAVTREFAGTVPGGLTEEAGEDEAAEEESKKGKKKKKKVKAKKEKKEKKAGEGGLVESIFNASPYTVMLAISLAAILLACLFLFIELGNYGRDIKAQDAKQRVSVAAPFQSAPPSTTATA